VSNQSGSVRHARGTPQLHYQRSRNVSAHKRIRPEQAISDREDCACSCSGDPGHSSLFRIQAGAGMDDARVCRFRNWHDESLERSGNPVCQGASRPWLHVRLIGAPTNRRHPATALRAWDRQRLCLRDRRMPGARCPTAQLGVLHHRAAFACGAAGVLFRSIWALESGLQRLHRKMPRQRPSRLGGRAADKSRSHSSGLAQTC